MQPQTSPRVYECSQPTQQYEIPDVPEEEPPANPMLSAHDVVAKLEKLDLNDSYGAYEWRSSVLHEDQSDEAAIAIGRAAQCDLRISDNRVSGCHVRIRWNRGLRQFHICDSSSNGTWVDNGRQCESGERFVRLPKGQWMPLKHNQCISLVVPFPEYDRGVWDAECKILEAKKKEDKSINRRATPFIGAWQFVLKEQLQAYSSAMGDKINDKYDKKCPIGSGNFSQVYLAFRKKDGLKVAIKAIDTKRFEKFRAKKKSNLDIESEVLTLSSLKHENILKFIECVREEDIIYLVTEILDGGDLLEYCLAHERVEEELAKLWFKGIAEGVKYLHTKGIVHRDLKPENILLTDKTIFGVPKIADFGLATVRQAESSLKTLCGTPHYYAPELIDTQKKRVDGYGPEVDIWSLGCILYIMLSGNPPFEDDGLYWQIQNAIYTVDGGVWDHISEEGKDLVTKMMCVDPKQRITIDAILSHPWVLSATDAMNHLLNLRPPHTHPSYTRPNDYDPFPSPRPPQLQPPAKRPAPAPPNNDMPPPPVPFALRAAAAADGGRTDNTERDVSTAESSGNAGRAKRRKQGESEGASSAAAAAAAAAGGGGGGGEGEGPNEKA
ncbi:unnamed protein product [Vitrella brassicaformis CCMP3155]|uniref:Uncharacterized protein n=1 Tax=Vitrella brassicaformis (strain CCMP3155) TaxID=1169540 RepID=A0A0G4GWH5_VITBC|nr:unnamed protein product [Vitrella brassicaformis CCMP3155]|eukprot:CEM35095.1 unnamed protein product [Vitrella brassicaformis CCMP3155]